MSSIIKSEHSNLKKRTSLYRGLIVVIVVALAFSGVYYSVYWCWSTYLSDPTLEKITDEEKVEAIKTIEGSYVDIGEDKTLKARYVTLVGRGDLDSAQLVYQQAIDSAGDEDAKLVLLQEYYQIANYSENYDHALDAALRLGELRPGYEVYTYIASTYEKLGDNQNVAEYLRKALDLLDPDKEADRGAIEYIEGRLSDLGESV